MLELYVSLAFSVCICECLALKAADKTVVSFKASAFSPKGF